MLTLRTYAILGLFMVLSTCPPVLAEVYVYRDFRGQRHFTNRPEKIPLRYRSDAKRLPAKSRITRTIGPPPTPAVSPAPQPAPAAAVPPPSLPPALPLSQLGLGRIGITQLNAPAPPQIVVTRFPAAPARPVDTHQFGLLQLRMTQAQVLQRLGPPLYTSKEVWHYPGTRRIPSTRLVFNNGLLTRASRGRSGASPGGLP